MRGRAALLFAISHLGCTAPEVLGRHPDSGEDTAVADVAETDGEPQCGHDEDRDGFCDEVDTCPTIENPQQELEKKIDLGFTRIGSACAPSADFAAAKTRAFWDPFTDQNMRWLLTGSATAAFHPWPVAQPDSMLGGEFGSPEQVPIALMRTRTAPLREVKTAVVTAVFQKPFGGAPSSPWGIFIGGGSPLRFLGCYYLPGGALDTLDSYAVGVVEEAGCTDSRCPLKPLATSLRPDFLIPESPTDPSPIVGLRLAITPKGTQTMIECRVFDPRIPTTLTSAGVKRGAIFLTPETSTLPLGPELGVFTDRTIANITSIDVVIAR